MSAGLFSYRNVWFCCIFYYNPTCTTCNMGPIMQERTASTTLKRVVSKEKIRVKNTENSVLGTSSKKGNKVKKAVGQVKNGLPGPGQEKDMLTAVQKGAQSKGSRHKSHTTWNTSKLSRYVYDIMNACHTYTIPKKLFFTSVRISTALKRRT